MLQTTPYTNENENWFKTSNHRDAMVSWLSSSARVTITYKFYTHLAEAP